jgi:hypothetical protein
LKAGYWHIELKDKRVFSFYQDKNGIQDPTEKIDDFHHEDGVNLILDIP